MDVFLFGGICLLIGVVLFLSNIFSKKKYLSITQYLPINGEVILSAVKKKALWGAEKNEYIPKIKYKYTVDGTEYTNDKIRLNGFYDLNYADAYSYCKQYKKDSPVTIYYNRNKPQNSLLSLRKDDNTHERSFLGILGFVLCGISSIGQEVNINNKVINCCILSTHLIFQFFIVRLLLRYIRLSSKRRKSFLSSQKINAKITSISIDKHSSKNQSNKYVYMEDIVYCYMIGNEEFFSSGSLGKNLSSREDVVTRIKDLKIDQEFQVYYNPKNPKESMIYDKYSNSDLEKFILSGFLICWSFLFIVCLIILILYLLGFIEIEWFFY